MAETANRIQIYRGRRLIADGATAKVNGVPMGSCERVMDIYALILAAGISVIQLGNIGRQFDLQIRRQHGSTADSIIHGLITPQLAASVDDFAIWFSDGTDIHKFTSTSAGWQSVKPDRIEGGETLLTYSITAPPFVYTINASTTPITYSDAL